MRISKRGVSLTARNQPMRKHIAQSLIRLMETKALDHITILEIVKKANISRMTFYKYYGNKTEVLDDYMYEIVSDYVEDAHKETHAESFSDPDRICHCFQFFKQYSGFVLTLIKANMHSVVLNALNKYMDDYARLTSGKSRYDLYYYAGALCNTYFKWIEGGMKETADEIARTVSKRLSHALT
ncbi:MAG: TetR/AcrR family transcriptional regulator [Oscillospiraceae bacterium]